MDVKGCKEKELHEIRSDFLGGSFTKAIEDGSRNCKIKLI